MVPLTVLHNARIHTLDKQRPLASAVAIQGGRFIEIGNDWKSFREIDDYQSKVLHFDLGGRVVLPGLVDSHLHLKNYALSLRLVNCETATRAECLQRVALKVSSSEAGSWIQGHGWNQTRWEQGYGSAEELDRISGDHPVYLTAKSLHAGWANSHALRIANIDAETPDPSGGVIQRKPDGTPTGILFEGAMQMVSDVIPLVNPSELEQAILDAQHNLFKMGLTGVHDFDRRTCFVALQNLHQRGKLILRVQKSLPFEDLDSVVRLGLQSGFGDDTLWIGSLKIFADGALGPRTAAMVEPYEGEPANRGILLFDAEAIVEGGRAAVENGISLAIHAIGDLANHEVLNGIEQLREYERTLELEGLNPNTRVHGLRHRIEHVQLIHPQDLGRLAGLDVIASMQPVHATSDMLMADKYWGARAANSYAWNSLGSTGVKLAFGSDAPVESPNPFWGIHAAVTRCEREGSPSREGWYPEQCLQIEQALYSYTTGAAYAAGKEDRLGVIKPTYLADLIVLDIDPFACEPADLWRLEPVATMVGGEWVYGVENLT